MAKTLKYKILAQRHIDYDPLYALQCELLYTGGKDILKQAHLFIPQDTTLEQTTVYRQRLQYASYHNHISEIENEYIADLFSHSLSVLPAPDATDESTPGELPEIPEFYEEFAKDADLSEHSFENVLSQVFQRGVNQGIGYLGLDFPDPATMDQALLDKEMDEISLADEEEFGLSRAYTYNIPYCTIINWQYDQFNKFQWCVLEDIVIPQEDFRTERLTHIYKYKVWLFNDQGEVCYECYEREYPLVKNPEAEDDFVCVKEGVVSFKRIPIKVLCIPEGLCIGHQSFSIAIENFRLRTQINFGESRVANEVLFFGASDPFSNPNAIPSGASEDDNRAYKAKEDLINKGALVGNALDKVEFIGPSGEIYQVLNEQLKDNVNEMHRIHHLMASTIASKGTSQSQAKSGSSKQADMDAKSKVLLQYAMILKNFAKEIYDDIADARNEEDIYWQVFGMDDFSQVDPADLNVELAALPAILQIFPSPTYHKQKLSEMAMKTINVSPEMMDVIKRELDAAVDGGIVKSMPGGEDDANSPNNLQDQKNKADAKVNSKSLGSDKKSNPASSDPAQADSIGEDGNKQADPAMHLADGSHIPWQIVWDAMKEDYDEEDMEFVKSVAWQGPVSVNVNQIDMSEQDQWAANKPGKDGLDKVEELKQKIADEGFTKPIQLLNEPHNNEKLFVLNGRHRIKAAESLGIPVLAYVGSVGSITDDMSALHSKQNKGKS